MSEVIETLDDTGFFFEQVALKAARLVANFGDGYTRGARIGSTEGLRAFRIKIDALPDRVEFLIGELTRARYLFEFWRRHKLEKDSEIFRMRDPFPADATKVRPYVFARFEGDELDFGMLCEEVFNAGLSIIQARIPNLDPNNYNPQEI